MPARPIVAFALLVLAQPWAGCVRIGHEVKRSTETDAAARDLAPDLATPDARSDGPVVDTTATPDLPPPDLLHPDQMPPDSVPPDAPVCLSGAAKKVVIPFETYVLNLDTGNLEKVSPMGLPKDKGWDLKVAYNATKTVHSVIFHNQQSGVEIVHLKGKAMGAVTSCDIPGVAFTKQLVDEPFDGARVILIRTDTGAVFKLGEATEDTLALTCTYAKLL